MTFRIRKGFLVPLGLLSIETVALFITCFIFNEPVAKRIIVGVLILPVVVLFLECLFRRTNIEAEQVCIRKLLRRKCIRYADMTAVETVQVKKRAFVTLCTDDDFMIVSNAYSNFPAMISALLLRVPQESISAETAEMAQDPPRKTADIVSCWLGVILLGFILFAQMKTGLG
ncbi:MAG: hypothetical protein RBR06_08270 [Desulfuromonadaceae bacterium]|nr:hypothetical protein [Desulfuromonadaceae bacterium]